MSTQNMTDAEIRALGWQALVDKLGPSGAVRFAVQTERGSGDDAELRDRMLGELSADELVARMRESKRAGRTVKKAGEGAKRPAARGRPPGAARDVPARARPAGARLPVLVSGDARERCGH
jgi:hypothetical protein